MICLCLCLLKFIRNRAWYPRTIFTHRKGFVSNGMWLHQASSSHPNFQCWLSHRVQAIWCGCQLLITNFFFILSNLHTQRVAWTYNTEIKSHMLYGLRPPGTIFAGKSSTPGFMLTHPQPPQPQNINFPLLHREMFLPSIPNPSQLIQRREVGKAKEKEWRDGKFSPFSSGHPTILVFPGATLVPSHFWDNTAQYVNYLYVLFFVLF